MITEVVIPFTFDTGPIEEMLQQQGWELVECQIKGMVAENIERNLPKKSIGYGYNASEEPSWKLMLENQFQAFLSEHTQEIIDEAAVLLAMRGNRKRAWKDILEEYRKEGK